MSLPLNYAFILEEVLLLSGGSKEKKVLDYGCGKGLLVEEGLSQGIDIYGVELFSHGSGIDIKQQIREKNWIRMSLK